MSIITDDEYIIINTSQDKVIEANASEVNIEGNWIKFNDIKKEIEFSKALAETGEAMVIIVNKSSV